MSDMKALIAKWNVGVQTGARDCMVHRREVKVQQVRFAGSNEVNCIMHVVCGVCKAQLGLRKKVASA